MHDVVGILWWFKHIEDDVGFYVVIATLVGLAEGENTDTKANQKRISNGL